MNQAGHGDKSQTNPQIKLDEIGYWSEIKLDIVREYAAAYSKILSAQQTPKLHHLYIDAFAGPGLHISKQTGEFIPGSPLNALLIDPPFAEYHLIDLDGQKIEHLQQLTKAYSNVYLYQGDCNEILLKDVFRRISYKDRCRALCLLDPYGLHLDWKVIESAGKSRTVEMFLNFPVLDMNRNVLWRNPEAVAPTQAARMDRFWGDNSWRNIAYNTTGNLFEYEEKVDNDTIAQAFRNRLRTVAGFSHVPEPIPMRNPTGGVVYYLFFASHKPVAARIVTDIFNKYRDHR